jgi:N-acetylmuramoyl-L-alanine amidase-like protein
MAGLLRAALAISLLLATSCIAFAQQEIISRQQWRAHAAIAKRQPPIRTGRIDNTITVSENELIPRQRAEYLTVHHTAVPAKPGVETAVKLRAFQQQMQNGYWIDTPSLREHVFLGDIPYHYYISVQGDVAEGRELDFAAYSNTQYRTPIANHITVTLEGNFQTQKPSAEQISSLIERLTALAKEHSVPLNHISYHAAVAQTDCPGRNLIQMWPDIVEALKSNGVADASN